MPGTASNFPDAELKVNSLRKSLKPRDCDNWSSSTWRSCTHRSHQRTTYQSVSELSYVALCGIHLDTQSASEWLVRHHMLLQESTTSWCQKQAELAKQGSLEIEKAKAVEQSI